MSQSIRGRSDSLAARNSPSRQVSKRPARSPSLSVRTPCDPYRDLHRLDDRLIDLDGTGSSAACTHPDRTPRELQPQPSLLDLIDGPSSTIYQPFATEQLGLSLQPPDQRYTEECQDCGSTSEAVSFCNVCDLVYCAECWDRQLPHRRRKLGPGGIPHEKTSASVAQKVQQVLEPPTDEYTRERLHFQDAETAWFGISRPDDGPPLFQDYGRFTELMELTEDTTAGPFSAGSAAAATRDNRTPSLVSFVGETGAGKSTLIKLLIDLNTEAWENYATPVVGASGVDVPTSEDVHLYIEPRTAETDAPVLFADCEGLTGGTREPLGAVFKKKRRKTSPRGSDSSDRLSRKGRLISERDISWADNARSRSREFAVTNLYPRLLYTFSDVVVFVLRNPRVVESVFERLIEWAAAALEMSSNQPVLPHAVIVLNACGNDIDPSLWNPEITTEKILESLSRTVNQNRVFKKQAQIWRERNCQIETVEQLMRSFYSSVIIIRIPAEGRPKLIQQQAETLYNSIREACNSARDSRADLRMLFDVEELQSYLDCACDHFARTLDQPFDFVQASLANSPIPLDFGGNVLKLAISLMEAWKDEVDARTIFQELSYMVASCIMFDIARNKNKGSIDSMFPHYLDHLDAALENFCNSHWPCEFVKPGTTSRCVNVRSGHAKGHQSKNGKVLAVGIYQSHFSYTTHREEFERNVYFNLKDLHAVLCERVRDGEPEDIVAADVHQNTVLANFVARCSRDRGNSLFSSHTACFCCLFELPEHALPCGHIICTSCAQVFGSSSVNELTVPRCPICPPEANECHYKIPLKPKGAGVRILTLDGGGMRGIVELEVLLAIERAMGGKLPIQSFFDLIVGTSTGGLIALGLVGKAWSVTECLEHFERLCNQAFTRRAGGDLPIVGFFINSYNQSLYETSPLEKALMDAFGDDEYLFGGRSGIKPYRVRVAITTASAATGTPIVLSNYNLPYQFQRAETLASELKLWEAGRATSAAPRFFKSFNHEPSRQVYLDGALYHNNPIAIAQRENNLIWPEQPSEFPDVVVSLGTGASLRDRQVNSDHLMTPQQSRRGIFSYGKSLIKIAKDIIDSSLDCEKTWEAYINGLPKTCESSRFVRINPEVADLPQLDDIGEMKSLQTRVQNKLQNPRYEDILRRLAMRLVATSFFFEVQEPISDDKIVKGSICCRLPKDSPEVGELGKLIRSWTPSYGQLPFFFIYEKGSDITTAQKIPISEDMIKTMVVFYEFRMPRRSVQLQLSNTFAPTEIQLCFNQSDAFPISGFPRILFEESLENRTNSRRNLAVTSSRRNRWVSQFGDRPQRKWTPPTGDIHRTASVTGYAQSTNPLGYASQEDLLAMAHTLKYGAPPTQYTVAAAPQNTGTLASGTAYLRGALRGLVHRSRSPMTGTIANSQPPGTQQTPPIEPYPPIMPELIGDHIYNDATSSTGVYEMDAESSYPVELPG
ncbi:lysophospholipase-like protein [Diplodia corticola]|uniref:Lysophospholipase-like protein n=1 Tax=Diplodia corticola TaxID=236234 RepID=A0A1J9QR77_9PEZI|nr:lysophospholipase-like protein [Diplodia corticola]OJD31446.1 lysophospholipase-like protein [Diplodia corticola]